MEERRRDDRQRTTQPMLRPVFVRLLFCLGDAHARAQGSPAASRTDAGASRSTATPQPPAVSAAMKAVILGAGLGLREELVAIVGRKTTTEARHGGAVVVMAGLARECDKDAVVNAAFHDCGNNGSTAVVALLQLYENRTPPGENERMPRYKRGERARYSFDWCAARLIAAAQASDGRCKLVLGRQWFDEGVRTPVCKTRAKNNNAGRSIIQTLAVGRAFEWARAYFPSAQLFVRARLDGLFCVPFQERPHVIRNLLVAMDGVSDRATGAHQIDDVFAIMSADIAQIYFGAWRVWLPFNCSNTCFAGNGSNVGDAIMLDQTLLCSGEAPLNKWLTAHAVVPTGLIPAKVVGLIKHRKQIFMNTTASKFRAKACPLNWRSRLRPLETNDWTCRGGRWARDTTTRDYCELYKNMTRQLRCPSAFAHKLCVYRSIPL